MHTAEYGWSYGKYASYAISVSAVAISFSSMGLLLNKFSQDMYEKAGTHMNTVNFVWTFIGACFLTFYKPFTKTSNGYFAAWVAVYGSAMSMGMDANKFGSKVKGFGAVTALLASSIVVLIASIGPIQDNNYKNEAIYAMVLACVTLAFISLVMFMEKRDSSISGMIYFLTMGTLAVAWIVEACFVTFRGPFEVTGNGYFGSWAAAAASSAVAFAAKSAL